MSAIGNRAIAIVNGSEGYQTLQGVSNGPIGFKSALAFAPIACKKYTGASLLVLAKFLQLLTCSYSH